MILDLTVPFQVVIPAQGMIEFRNHLSELLSEYWPSDDASVGRCDEGDISAARGKNFPQPKSLRVHQGKVLYFDSGVNPRGNFLRISQVCSDDVKSSIIPITNSFVLKLGPVPHLNSNSNSVLYLNYVAY